MLGTVTVVKDRAATKHSSGAKSQSCSQSRPGPGRARPLTLSAGQSTVTLDKGTCCPTAATSSMGSPSVAGN